MVGRRCLVLALSLALSIVAGTAAYAQSAVPQNHEQNAKQLFDNQQWEEAATEFAAAYRRNNDPSMLFNMALCYRRAGNGKRALDLYRRYLIEAPESPRRATVEAKIAELRRELAAESSAATSAATALSHDQEGKRLYEAGQWAEAAKEFEAAYAVNKDPALLYNVALCYRRAGDGEQALDRYRKYLTEVPDSPKRATTEVRIKELEQELAASKKSAKGAGERTDAEVGPHEAEGKRLFERGQWAQAATEFEAAYAESRAPALHYNIALCYRKAGNSRRALDNYQKYLAKVPDAANRATVEARIKELQQELANGGAPAPAPAEQVAVEETVDVCDPPCGVGRMCMPSGACVVPQVGHAAAAVAEEDLGPPTLGPKSFVFGIGMGYAAGGSLKISDSDMSPDGGFLLDLYFDKILIPGLSVGGYITRTGMSKSGVDATLWSLGGTVKGRIRLAPAIVLRPGLVTGYNHISSSAFGDDSATGWNIGGHFDLAIATSASVAIVPRVGFFTQPSGGYKSVDVTMGPHFYIAVGMEFGK